jgi:flagellar motility protein MotE (MotC chaperone)
MTKTIDGAIVDWLEEIPVEELDCEMAQMIVDQFRRDDISVTEAMQMLEDNCLSQMKDWLEQNKTFSKMFK